VSDVKRTVLVIDDNPWLRDMFREVLVGGGYDVVLAEDGRAGLSRCRRGAIDLVITDLFMPDIEGLEFIRTLRREQPTVPIIAISAGGELGQTRLLEVAERLGAVRVLEKPVSVGDLQEAVRASLPP
jgi:CheY-like chemotaxis protein